ncbi:MAG: hypothetical protein OXC00_13175 [Acidimicrobiaceae bacterium]|nr:hypothetical protein [Acidimicrobiaceae bacterium]
MSTEALPRTLASDVGGGRPTDTRTGGACLATLRWLFMFEDVPAWSAPLRRRAHLRRAAKRHLTEPSLAEAAPVGSPRRLRSDLSAGGRRR